jgi:hypothetical protein
MTAFALQQLAWHLPPPEDDVRDLHWRRESEAVKGLIRHRESEFIEAYTNLAFGWYAAQTLAANHIPFPAVFEGEDDVLFRAYLYNCSTRYYNQDIAEALALTSPKMKLIRETLEALLVSPGITVEAIADSMRLRPDLIFAYEKLFFNILDRKADHAFIAQIIYPDGRFVEAYENYTNQEDLGQLLKRAGYNNGVYDTLYLAGFSGGLLHSEADKGTANKLEGLIMANGYILARNGWMNQQTNGTGLFNARTLLAAAKQGGADPTPQSPMSSMGRTLVTELKRVKGDEANTMAEKRGMISKKADVKISELPV